MALDFDKFAAEGNAFIKHLAQDLGYPKERERAGRVLRAVLHALRNRLTTEESVQLLAQLPMFLKAVYVEGWSLKKKGRIKNVDDFYNEVRGVDGVSANSDFYNDRTTDKAIKAVFKALSQYVSEGEMEDVKAELPKELKHFAEPEKLN